MGRPTDCTPETTEKVCAGLRMGMTWAAAAAYAGMTATSLFAWKARGREGEQPFADFLEATQRAEDECEARDVAKLDELAQMDCQGDPAMLKIQADALKFRLERRRPDGWGRRDKVESTVKLDGPSKQVADALASLGAALDPKP